MREYFRTHPDAREKRKTYLKEYYKSNREQILQQMKEFREENKELISERKKKYYYDNHEKIAEINRIAGKKYRAKKTPGYVTKIAKYLEYSKTEEGKQRSRILQRKRYAENPEKYRNKLNEARAKKRNLRYDFTDSDWALSKKHFDDRCAYCGDESQLQREHFFSANSGGGYTKDNIIPACKSCNSSKRDKLFSHWYPSQVFYSTAREKKILKYLGKSKDPKQLNLVA